MRISIIVPGEPVAKARPYVRRDGRVFTPEKTALYEQAVGLYARAAMKGRKILTGGVRLSMFAYFPIPKSWSKEKKAMARAGKLRHTKKPDLSNVLKSVEDALNGIVYADDSQIYHIGILGKSYSDTPETVIVVESDDETQGL